MASAFKDREQAFEAKFVHDEEMRFRLAARRDKLFAHWAAERLKLPDGEEAKLLSAVLSLWGAHDHDQAVIDHIAGVLAVHGVAPTGQNLPGVLRECGDRAKTEVLLDGYVPDWNTEVPRFSATRD